MALAVGCLSTANAEITLIGGKKSDDSESKEKKTEVKLYGFIRNYVCVDSRKNLQSGAEQFNQIPMDESLNSIGEDLNAIPTARFLRQLHVWFEYYRRMPWEQILLPNRANLMLTVVR